MGLSALARAHCLCANTPSSPVWQQRRPRSIPCAAPPPAYWPLPIHTQPLSLLSGQQLQSLALHGIANGFQTILQERKELCSAIYWVILLPLTPEINEIIGIIIIRVSFVIFFSVSFRSECSRDLTVLDCVFVVTNQCFCTAGSGTRSTCILCWHDCITISNLHTSVLVSSMLLTASFFKNFYTNCLTLEIMIETVTDLFLCNSIIMYNQSPVLCTKSYCPFKDKETYRAMVPILRYHARQTLQCYLTEKNIPIQTHIYSQFRGRKNLHVSGLWEEARIPKGNLPNHCANCCSLHKTHEPWWWTIKMIILSTVKLSIFKFKTCELTDRSGVTLKQSKQPKLTWDMNWKKLKVKQLQHRLMSPNGTLSPCSV